MKTLSPPAKSSRPGGQTLALLAFVLPVLIGAMGLATDVANFYFNYVRVQTGADASVLSGVKYLPDQPGAAISTATTYATSFNSIAAAEIVSTTTSYDASLCPAPGSPPPPPVPGCELTMTIQRIVPYYFARLVGVNSGTMSVTASATAGVPAASVNYGVVPIGVQVGTPFPYSDGAVAALPFVPKSHGGIHGCGRHLEQPCAGRYRVHLEPSGRISEPRVSINEPVAPDKSVRCGNSASAAITKQIDGRQAVDSTGTYSVHTANDMRA